MNYRSILFSLAALATLIGPAWADLESMKTRIPKIVELKNRGVIGEQPDGYLGLVKEDAAAKTIVEAENADRKEEYSRRAQEQGQAVDILAKVLGEARVRQEKPGRFIRKADGQWKKTE